MSYQVLARKYRPQRFEEVVGQQHVTQTLQNALEQKRIHHAYLFTGARGVGKTTIARILAKALNCEKGVHKEPCNQCGNCLNVLEGRSLDVQEIDGASNTGVDDVRQIREQVKYMPAQGAYKIYIIDEVHMLSTSAFNALLKTLEEPPPHVVFVFATTEPHKIPATILSRCQRYDFRRIPTRTLANTLKNIAQAEGIQITEEALYLIAQEAAGSLRDGQSLLDQAIAFSGNKVTVEALKQMLGFLDRTQLFAMLGAILKKDREGVLSQLNQFYQTGADLNRLAQDLLGVFRDLYLVASLRTIPEWLEFPQEEKEQLKAFSQQVALTEIDQLFQLIYRGVEELARSSSPKMLFEVLLIRMTLVSEVMPVGEIVEKLEALELSGVEERREKVTPPIALSPGAPKPIAPRTTATPDWNGFLQWLQKTKPQLASIIAHGELIAFEGDAVSLSIDPASVYGEMLQEEDRKKQFEAISQSYFSRPLKMKLVFRQNAKAVSPEEDAMAKKRKLKETALQDQAVQEAANVLGAVVEEVRTELDS